MLKSHRPGTQPGFFVSGATSPDGSTPEPDALRLTPGVAALEGEQAFAVAARARELEALGRAVIHLEIGEPDTPTPAHIVEAGVRALRDGATRYAPPAGTPALRAAIAAHLRERGVSAGVEHIVVTSGAKPMLLHAALALVQPGDDVLVPDPGFPIYASAVRLAGARAVPYAATPDAFGANAITAALTPHARLLVLNVPGNPTGHGAPPAELDAIAELAERHDLAVLSDEIYSRLRYDGAHESIAARPGMARRTIIVDGFSKTYAMTGWRLGYGCMPPRLAERVTTLVVNSTSCVPPFVQVAGLAALTGPQDCVARLVAGLQQRRDAFVPGLNAIPGVRCALPAGAFYAFPDVGGLLAARGQSSAELAHDLLHAAGVATLDGGSFGARGAGHLRLSFAAPAAELAAALHRIQAFAQHDPRDRVLRREVNHVAE